MDNRPGCLVGLLKISLLNWAYNGLQRAFGWKSHSCLGCGCGLILFILFILILFSILGGTDWTHLVQAFSAV
jgi:hypothetical protein